MMNTIYQFHIHHVHVMLYINPYLSMRLRVVSKHLHNPNGNIDWMTGFIAKPCCTKPMHLYTCMTEKLYHAQPARNVKT